MSKVTKKHGKAFAGVLNSLMGLSVKEGIDILMAVHYAITECSHSKNIDPSEVAKYK